MLILNNWAVWQLTNFNGRMAKVPKQVNGKMAKSDDPTTWTDIKTAVDCINKYPQAGLGLAFFLPNDRSFSFVDLDSMKASDPVAIAVMALVPCYAEISQSGNGFHFIFKGSNPGRRKRKTFEGDHHENEWYDQKRFIALTTNRINLNGNDFSKVPDLVELTEHQRKAIYELIMEDSPAVEIKNPSPVDNNGLSFPFTVDYSQLSVPKVNETGLLDKMLNSSQGAKIHRFMYGGWEKDYKDDWSTADMAFANMLAWWCQKDIAKMRSIFESSVLYRPKDAEKRNNSTYLDELFAKAISDTTSVYNPNYRSKAVVG